MYYEEKVIDGVLCARGDPHTPFRAFAASHLTQMLLEERAKSEQYRQDAEAFAALRETIGKLVPDMKG